MVITRVYTRMGLVRVLVKRQFERQAIEAFNHSVTVNDKVFRITIELYVRNIKILMFLHINILSRNAVILIPKLSAIIDLYIKMN